MALLDIDSLTPGMKIGKDVIETSGQVLLRIGTEITEKHLRVLRSWGVQQVEIEGPKPPDAEANLLSRATPAMLAEAQTLVDEHFLHTDAAHPAIAELRRLSILAELRAHFPAAQPPPAP